jgi:transcriptional regulator of arginine metabolism
MEKHGLAEQANSIAGILSVEFSSFMAVIRTKPGYAGMVASMIDDTIGHTIMGTVAGDDTVFIALRDGTSKETILDNLEKIAPGISQKQL